MPQLVLFATELTCMQLTEFEIDLVHKHPPPHLDESDKLFITCRVEYHSAFYCTSYSTNSLHFKVIF